MTGIAPADALGRPCWQIIRPDASDKPPACVRSCLALKSSTATVLTPAEGDEPCAAMPLPDPKGGAVIWMPATEAHLCAPVDPMEQILVRGSMSEHLGDVKKSLDFLRRYTAADDCELFLIDEAHEQVLHTGCTGLDTEALMELTHIPLGAGYPGGVTARQRPMLTNDFQNDQVFLRASVRRCGLRSFLGVPLSMHGQPLGYLGLGWRDARVPMSPLLQRLEGLKPLLLAGLPRTRAVVSSRMEPEAALRLRCLGPLEVRLHGLPVPAQAFVRRQAITLLKLLALRAPSPVHRDVLIDHLWPEADARRGGNRLHGVVHALRSALGQSFIGYEQDAYFLDTRQSIFVDLLHFRSLLQKARSAAPRAVDPREISGALEEAVRLYEGDLFADDPYTEWLDAPRMRLRDQYLQAVRELTTRYARAERHEDALRVLRAALALDPLIEDLHQKLIASLLALGRRSEALEHYDSCVALIRRSVDAEPTPETLALGRRLRGVFV